MEFYIGERFEKIYPPEAALWANENGAVIRTDGDGYIIDAVERPTPFSNLKGLSRERQREALYRKLKFKPIEDDISMELSDVYISTTHLSADECREKANQYFMDDNDNATFYYTESKKIKDYIRGLKLFGDAESNGDTNVDSNTNTEGNFESEEITNGI